MQQFLCLLSVKQFPNHHVPAKATLGARDFSSPVSGFCQVFIVTLRPKMCRPSANTENSRRTREKPLVPRVCQGKSYL